jgi:hypothetical protein
MPDVAKYNITKIQYRNIYGKLLWEEPMDLQNLWRINDELCHNSIWFTVERVAVVDDIQQVNLDTERESIKEI